MGSYMGYVDDNGETNINQALLRTQWIGVREKSQSETMVSTIIKKRVPVTFPEQTNPRSYAEIMISQPVYISLKHVFLILFSILVGFRVDFKLPMVTKNCEFTWMCIPPVLFLITICQPICTSL